MSADREELHRLVENLPEEQLPSAVADVKRRLSAATARRWPPDWFGAATAADRNTAARSEELLDNGFGRSA